MFSLKNINKNIFFFALFTFFVFFPAKSVFALCNIANPCTSPDIPICGDSYKEATEGCDDGNNISGDGCTSGCAIQSGWYCSTVTGQTSVCYRNCGNGITTGTETCDWGEIGRPGVTLQFGGNGTMCTSVYNNPGLTCNYCNTSCQSVTLSGPRCGDSIVQYPYESCDDGNTISNDGCNSNCSVIEDGYTCQIPTPGTTGPGGPCIAVCGDGKVLGAETCDQGFWNLTNNDGCSSTCQQETGWNCIENPCAGRVGAELTSCSMSYGLVCQLSDTTCIANMSRSFCSTTCGDGIKVGSEACDDGNTITETCTYGQTSCAVCNNLCQSVAGAASYCGDNIKNGTEVCDGTDKNQQTCPSQGFTNGTLTCNASCNGFNLSACYNQTCRNAVREGTEVCDITALNDQSCETQNFTGGTLACSYDCNSFNTSACYTCGNNIVETGEDCDDGNTVTEACAYGLRSCAICDNTCHTAAGATSYCSDSTVNGPEECDYDSLPALSIPHNYDGCNTECIEEDGWSCFTSPATGKNICISHCGNETVESNAFFTEECDEGAEGAYKTATDLTTAPYNGDRCIAVNYGETCNWCTTDCKQVATRGPYCGDGTMDGNNEQCDDGNFNAGDGCSECIVEDGWTCKGLYSVCTTTCGDLKCVSFNNRENCANCSTDCGSCPLGQRPGVAIAHKENLFVNFFDKLKATFTRPTLLINIPGVKIDDTGLNTPVLPTPVISDYPLNMPTTLLIGDETYTFTVFKADQNTKEVTFSIR